MANIKFSAFTQKVVQTDVDFLVGYTGADNVRISPSTIGQGVYLPLAGGTMTGNILLEDSVKLSIGTSDDFNMFFNGVDTTLQNITGNLNIINKANDKDITLQSDDGAGGVATYLTLDGSTTDAYFSNPGNVGIGTASPNYKLSVDDNSITNIPKTLLQFDAASIADNGGYNIDFRASANDLANRYVARIRGIRESSGAKSQLSFWTESGTDLLQRMTIRASGNVGIGTASPSYKFTAYGSSSDSEIVASFGSANDISEYTAIGLSGFIAGNDATKAGLALERTASFGVGKLHFLNNTTIDDSDMTLSDSRMVIDIDGNVGVGTTSPSSFNSRGRNLVVNSDGDTGITISANSTSSSTLLFADAFAGTGGTATYRGVVEYDHSNDSMAFSTSATEKMRIDSSGNVGIGTANPNFLGFLETGLNIAAGSSSSTTLQQAGLVISGSSDANDADDFSYLSFTNYQSTLSSNRVAEIRVKKVGTDVDTGEFTFYTANGTSLVEALTINSSQKVGIGTASPLADLTVATQMSSSRTSILYLDIDGTNTDGGGGEIVFSTSASSGDLTNYNAKVTGTRVSGDGGDSELGFWTTLVSDNVASQQRMVITKEGNVGIGTSSPASKLEVDGGDVEVSDSLNGLILKSPDGTRYRVTVANGGTLTVSAA